MNVLVTRQRLRAATRHARRLRAPEDSSSSPSVTTRQDPQRGRIRQLCGVAPQPASSGRTTGRHRLSRSGDRTANSALYIIAIVRMRRHGPTLVYVDAALPRASAKRSSAASRDSSHARSTPTCRTSPLDEPRSIERSQRSTRTSSTGSSRARLWITPSCAPKRLQHWEDRYNYDQPHGALGGQAPHERLMQKASAPLS